MYYTYAEKQGNSLFGTWQMRELAFDTMRRYLYYSAPVKESMVAPPNVGPNPNRSTPSHSSTTSAFTSPVTQSAPRMPSNLLSVPSAGAPHELPTITPPPPPPNLPNEIVWKKKIKVDKIVVVAKEHEFLLEDVHLTEPDLFQVEIHGELRVLQQGESPAPEPLLCPSTGLSGHPSRMRLENEDYTHDPLFLRELYEALRDQFTNLRLERERMEVAAAGETTSAEEGTPHEASSSRAKKIQTLQSPRKKDTASKATRVKLVFRLRIDYEFRRFWYVVQTVLGYDKLGTRPYRGLPPYDPRNGIVFGQIPIYCWHTFKALEKAVFYLFVRGDLVGRNTKGEIAIVLRGCFLCVTHDTIFVLRNTGSIPRWVQLNHVRDFYYNYRSRHPFFSFITDEAAADLIFIPQPPPFGAIAISTYNPAHDVLKVLGVVRETCLASLEIRRVINVHEVTDLGVTQFAESMESQLRRRLQFDPTSSADGSMSCPLPKEQLATVWREVQEIYASRDPALVSQAAIPVYANNTNAADLPTENVGLLARRLARERMSRDDIVGLPLETVQQLAAEIPRGASSSRAPLHRSADNVPSAGTSSTSQRHGLSHTSTAPVSLTDRAQGDSVTSSAFTVSNTATAIGHTRAPMSRLTTTTLVTPQLVPTSDATQNPLGDPNPPGMAYSLTNDSFSSYFSRSFGGASVQYGEPGACYITAADLAASRPPQPSDYLVDNHVVIAQTPLAAASTTAEQFLNNTEVKMADVMAASLSAMRQQRGNSQAHRGRRDPLDDNSSSGEDSIESPVHIYHSTVET